MTHPGNARLFARAALQHTYTALHAYGITPQTLKSHRPYTINFVDTETNRTSAVWDRGDGLAARPDLNTEAVKLIEAYVLLYTMVND